MASIHKRTLKDGSVRYYVMWRDPAHKQKKFGNWRRKSEADVYKIQVEQGLHAGTYVDPKAGEITVDELAPTWLAGKAGAVKRKYYMDLQTAYRIHVQPVWGLRPINGIRHSEVQTWVSQMSQGDVAAMDNAKSASEKCKFKPKSASVVQRAFGVLKGILEMARDDGLIVRLPTEKITLPRKVPKKRTYLTPEQLVSLSKASGRHEALVLTLGFCGLRWGEAAALRVEDVSVDERRLRIRRNWVRAGSEFIETEPKTWERRDVPVPEYVMAAIQKEMQGKGPDDLVFTDAGGRRIHEQSASVHPKDADAQQWFGNALRDAGVPVLTCHDLRHTAASIAVHSGANVKALQRMLGHKSAAMTLDRYADLFDKDLDMVSDAVGREIAKALR